MSGEAPRQLLDVFLPERLRARPESRRRARVIVGLALGIVTMAVPTLTARLIIGAPNVGLGVAAVAFFGVLAVPPVLARTGRMDVAGLLLTYSWFLAILSVAFSEGGMKSPLVVALPILPLLAFFTVGRPAGLWTAALVVVATLGFNALPRLGIFLPPTPLTELDETTLRSIIVAFATLTITFFAWIYERERQETEYRLNNSRQAAEHASQVKSQFLANMSHEIRTPMTGILGNADLLLAMDLAPGAEDHARVIASSVASLGRVLDDILDFSKMEADKLALELTHFPLRETIAETIRLLAPAADAKGISLRYKMADTLPNLRCGDQARLRQILINLLGNAVKFTSEGQVDVRVESDPEKPPEGVLICVSDTGIGIPEKIKQSLFTPFLQADNSMSRRFGGTGLGLAISSHLAQMMNGSISVASSPGKGSTFTVSIHLEIVSGLQRDLTGSGATAIPAAGVPRASARGRILLAEDDAATRLIAIRHLETLGYTVDAVTNGLEVLAALSGENPGGESHGRESHGGKSYAAILMDCQMPELDGYETCRRLRRDREELPVIAFTAHAMEGELEKCLAAGMNDYVTKPFRQADLARVLARWLPPPL